MGFPVHSCLMKPVRLKQMEQYILSRDFVPLDELCEHFHVSKNTVRADVNELAERGIIEKKYGGVEALTTNRLSSFNERQVKNIESKSSIGKCAASLIEEDDVIFVDSGTTIASIFVDGIDIPKDITVITNNLTVANQYERHADMKLIMLPGTFNPKTKSFSSLETIDSFKKYNIKKAFIAATGISENGVLSNSTPLEAKLKETAVEKSEQVILVADSSKVGKTAMINFSNLDEVDIWVCDSNDKDHVMELCKAHNVRPIFAEK